MPSKSGALGEVMRSLRQAADPEKAAFLPRFFRTGKGEYGEGDRFLGVTVPLVRRIARTYRDLCFEDIRSLVGDAFHEVRLTGLLILVLQFERGDADVRRRVVRFYLDHLDAVNNWDLVDVTAPQILGRHLLEAGETSMLDRFAATKDLWRQRVAILATFAFIRAGEYSHTLRIARALMDHPHDLIHKAVGWMLREVGNRDRPALETFLAEHAPHMPRTMLRYAIEKFDRATRQRYLTIRRVKRGMKDPG